MSVATAANGSRVARWLPLLALASGRRRRRRRRRGRREENAQTWSAWPMHRATRTASQPARELEPQLQPRACSSSMPKRGEITERHGARSPAGDNGTRRLHNDDCRKSPCKMELTHQVCGCQQILGQEQIRSKASSLLPDGIAAQSKRAPLRYQPASQPASQTRAGRCC